MGMGSRRSAQVLCVIALLAAFIAPGAAAAHTDLRASDPRPGQELSALPERIRLEFAQPVVTGHSDVTLTGPNGAHSVAGLLVDGSVVEAIVDPSGARTTRGSWSVGYRMLAADGHRVTGSIDFSVGGAAASAALSWSTARPWVIGSVLLAAVLVALSLLRPMREVKAGEST